MRKSRFTEEQIVGILKEHAAEVRRRYRCAVPAARDQPADVLPLAAQVRGHGAGRGRAAQGPRGGKRAPQALGRRAGARQPDPAPTLDLFIDEFLRGRSNPWGRWDAHVNGWLDSEAGKAGNLRVVRFETLRETPEAELADVLRFLGEEVDPSIVARAVENNTLERMREKEEEAPDRAFGAGVRRDVRFVKEGTTGGWRNELSFAHAEAITRAFADAMARVRYLGGFTR